MSEIKSAQAITFAPVDYATWRAEAERSLRGGDFDKRLVSRTLDGFDVQPLYSELEGSTGFPGLPPFTRGSKPVPNADEAWEIRQEFAHPNLKTTNEQILRDLDRGVSGISLIFDAGLSRGSDDASFRGVPVRSTEDMASVFDGVYFSMVGLSLNAGLNGHGVLALLAQHVANAGAAMSDVRGSLGYDPIGQLLLDGHLDVDATRAFDLGADLVRWTREHAPNLRPIAVSGRVVQEAGASEAQEIAWALSTGILWMRELTARGISANDAADALAFHLTVARDIFLEIAKLRAMRQVWARALEAIGVDPAHRAMDLNVRGSAATISQRDPWVNMLRVTGHTYSAALGGAQSITTPSFDEGVAVPAEFGRRIARNTQLILRDESHLVRVQDAAGGSFYFEKMTSNYAKLAWETMQVIEAAGGALHYATSGQLDAAVGAIRARRNKDIATRRMALTGVSEFPNLTEKPVDTPATSAVAPRTAQAVASSTADAVRAGRFDGSVMQAAIADVQGGALASAIFRAITVDSQGLQAPAMPALRYTGAWEDLRDAADALAARQGGFPQVFLACIGRIPEHRARATFAQNLFAAGGMNAPMNDGFESIEDAVDAFRQSGTDVACICSTDARYADIVVPLAAALRDAGARQIVVAGKAGEAEAQWREAGVSTFIYMGCDALSIVRDTLAGFGADLTSN